MSDTHVVEALWQIFYRNLVQPTVTTISVKYISRVRLYSMVVTKYKRKRSAVASRKLRAYYHSKSGPSSVVGIATSYGLDGPGIESRWERDFPHLSRPALGPIQPPVQWVPRLSRGVKSGRGVTPTPHLLLVPWSKKGTAKPLLPLWAVRLVQSLSACTRLHFTFALYHSKSDQTLRK
jgi:hypothetical protein